MDTDEVLPPNHHADHPGFSGPAGVAAAISILFKRRDLARRVADIAQVDDGDHVVDLGSGPGGGAREAARRGAQVTGVEPDEVMRRLARWTTRRSASIAYVDGGAEAIPVEDGNADVVWSIAAVHHWPDFEAGIAECHRILRSGGRLVFAEKATEVGATGLAGHGWTPQQADACAAALRAIGFVDVSVRDVRTDRANLVVTAVRD